MLFTNVSAEKMKRTQTQRGIRRSMAQRLFVTLRLPVHDGEDEDEDGSGFRRYRVILHEAGTKHADVDTITVESGNGVDELGAPQWLPVEDREEATYVLASLAARYAPVWEQVKRGMAAAPPTTGDDIRDYPQAEVVDQAIQFATTIDDLDGTP